MEPSPAPTDLTRIGPPTGVWWLLAVGSGVLTAAVLSLVVPVGLGAGGFLLGLYGVGALRGTLLARRVGSTIRMVDGRLPATDVRVWASGRPILFVSGSPAVVEISDGELRFRECRWDVGNVVAERWPTSQVMLGRRPSVWSGRAVALQTPSGPRCISHVSGTDPAMYWHGVVDAHLWDVLRQVLEVGPTSVLNGAPGWYPDPSGTGGTRWWDGERWA